MRQIIAIIVFFLISIQSLAQKTVSDTTVYISVGNNGSFPQFWYDGFKAYVKKTICPYTKGTRIISGWSFIVEKDGTYTHMENIYNKDVDIEKLKIIECAVNCMPDWIPAQVDGKRIRFRQTIFISTPDACIGRL